MTNVLKIDFTKRKIIMDIIHNSLSEETAMTIILFYFNEMSVKEIAARIEDPAVPLDEIDRCIKRSDELIARCREYLRIARQTTETLE